jgi:hypothetical protein
MQPRRQMADDGEIPQTTNLRLVGLKVAALFLRPATRRTFAPPFTTGQAQGGADRPGYVNRLTYGRLTLTNVQHLGSALRFSAPM